MSDKVLVKFFSSRAGRFASHSGIILLGQLTTTFLTVVTSVIIARKLGPSGKGELAIAMLLSSTLVTFSGLGFDIASPFLISRKEFLAEDIHATNKILFVARALFILISGCFAILLFRNSLLSGTSTSVLLLALFLAIAIAAFSFVSLYPLGLANFTRYSLNLLVPSALSLGLLAVTLATSKELRFPTLILNDLIAFSCAVFLLIVQINSLHKHPGKFSRRVARRSFIYGFPSYLSAITNFANNRLLWLLISFRGGKNELGIYILAQSLLEQGGLLLHPISTVLFSRVTRMKPEDVKRNTATIVFIIASLASLGVLIIFVLIDRFIPFVYGEQFAPSVKFIKYLSPILVLDGVSRATNSVLQGIGKTSYFLAATIGSTISGVSVAFFLYPKMGITGVAISSVISSSVMLAISAILLLSSLNKACSTPLHG